MAAADETAAIHLLKRAVEFDTNKRYAEALVCYREGIELLLATLKTIHDDKKKAAFRAKIGDYFDRAEKLKRLIDEIKESGKYHEQIQIAENSIGNSYEKVFARFFQDDLLDQVEIDDAYIKSRHQTHNFLRLCEMIVKLSKNVKKIKLLTTKDDNPLYQQEEKLNDIKESLAKRNITLSVSYSTALHDREIRLSTGWIIKIGRGLDYFKAPESRDQLCIGFHDLDLRPCYETTIDIFHKSNTRQK